MVSFARAVPIVVVVLLCAATARAVDRHYYVQAEDVFWDYTPQGQNVVKGRAFNAEENKFIVQENNNLGHQAWKIHMVEYTENFAAKKQVADEWKHLGLLAPVIRGEVGDVIYVHFRNQAQTSLSLHPHGVAYKKDSEGALYQDGTSGADKNDDSVAPGGEHTYKWDCVDRSGPSPNDPSSLVWLYHGHATELKNTNLGLIGAIIITAKGKARSSSNLMPNDVDREFVLLPNIFDESSSDYFDRNIAEFGLTADNIYAAPSGALPYKREERKESRQLPGQVLSGTFVQSCQKSTLNGYMFGNYFSQGNTHHFSMTEGERVRWYVISLGTYNSAFVNPADGLGSIDGFHSIKFLGQAITGNIWSSGDDHHASVVGVMPASMKVATMVAQNPGVWQINCGVGLHTNWGMAALFQVKPSGSSFNPGNPTGRTRDYYIAAEEVTWDYAPSGRDLVLDTDFVPGSDNGIIMLQTDQTIGRKYKKARFFEYTDDTFTTKKTIPAKWEHLGILGPLIRAEVGDVIKVHFKNKASRPYSITPAGLWTYKDSEGIPYNDGTTGADKADDSISPDAEYTYTWYVPNNAGPQADDGDSVILAYRSGQDDVADVHAGLVGPIIITRSGKSTSASDPTPKDIGNELVILGMVFNENQSPYIGENKEQYTVPSMADDFPQFPFSNWMWSINGRMFGNLEGLVMPTGTTTRVYAFGLGNIDGGPHALHFHGQQWVITSQRNDVLELIPAMTRTFEIQPQFVGDWLLHCHTAVHGERGMQAIFTVTGSDQSVSSGIVRRYYVAAEEVDWNYAPSGRNEITGLTFGSSSTSDEREDNMIRSSTTIGRRVQKGKYVQYTDSSFTSKVSAPAYLGILGPVIRAQVGDKIEIVFKNKMSFAASMHPHGLLYSNDEDIIPDGPDHIVAPGTTYTYEWWVPPSAGPAANDPSSISWLYYSKGEGAENHIDTGLVGPIVITRANSQTSSSDLKPKDVDREFIILQAIFREDSSMLWEKNLQLLNVDPNNLAFGSNERPHINGLMYGNTPGLEMSLGEKVRWYVMTTGTFDGLHTPHWHGNVVTIGKERTDVIELFPTSHSVSDMVADEAGTWLFHCHYSDHLLGGMVATYRINSTPTPSTPPTPTPNSNGAPTPTPTPTRTPTPSTSSANSLVAGWTTLVAIVFMILASA